MERIEVIKTHFDEMNNVWSADFLYSDEETSFQGIISVYRNINEWWGQEVKDGKVIDMDESKYYHYFQYIYNMISQDKRWKGRAA